MTRKSTTIDKARALFLAALMVLSVFGGSIAFSGGALAASQPSSISVGTNEVGATTTFTSTVETTAESSAGNVETVSLSFEGVDVSDYSKSDLTVKHDDGEVSNAISSVSSPSAGELEITLANGGIDLGGDTSDADSITVTTSVKKTQLPSNTGNYDASISLADSSSNIDSYSTKLDIVNSNTAPTIKSVTASNPSGKDVEVSVTSDEQLSTIGVDISGAESATLSTFPETKNDDGTYTYTGTYTGSTDGEYTATLNTAADNNGNDGASGEQATVVVDTTGPVFSDVSPADGTTVRTNESVFTVNITDANSEVDPSSIHVTVTDSEEKLIDQVGVSEANDGITFDGKTLTIDPSDAPIRPYADGTVTVTVTAADTKGQSSTLDDDGDDQIQFEVDTTQPSLNVELDSASSPVNDNETSVKVTANHGNTKIDAGNVTINVTDSAGNLVYDANTTSSDAVDASGYDSTDGPSPDSFTFNPDENDEATTPAYPEGTVNVEVTAVTDHGETLTETLTFTVDTTAPTVEGITVSDTMINESDAGETQTVEIQYSEKLSSTPSLSANDTGIASVSNVQLSSEDSSVVTAKLDIIDTDEEADVKLTASGADDLATNTQSEDGTKVISVDTLGPTISNSLSSPVTGYVNFDNKFSVSNADDNDVSYAYQEGSSWDSTASSTLLPTYFDTRNAEGQITIQSSVTDDNGNTKTQEVTVQVDNFQPSVSVVEDAADSTYMGQVDLSDVFDVEHASSTTYKFSTDGGSMWPDVPSAALSDGMLDTEALVSNTGVTEDSTIQLRAVATDDASNSAQTDVTGVTIDNYVETSSFDANDDNDDGVINVSFDSTYSLNSVNITISSADSYDDYDEVHTVSATGVDSNDDGDVDSYETQVQAPRDGSFDVELTDVEEADGRVLESSLSASAVENTGVSVDGEDPHITDAKVLSTSDSTTDVRVYFNEPISDLDETKISADSDTASADAYTWSGAEGYVDIEFDSVLQTGDETQVVSDAEAYTEVYSVTTQNKSVDETETIDTVQLDLAEGTNAVSVPAASGSVDLSSLDLSNVDVIWTYNDGSWQSYDPAATSNDFSSLEGGQGYIFEMSSADTIAVNAYNAPGGDVNTVPGTQDLESGWNLVGHWQEGQQDATKALKTLEDGSGNAAYDGVYEQSSTGSDSWTAIDVSTRKLQPGDAYWVFLDDDGETYAETPY